MNELTIKSASCSVGEHRNCTESFTDTTGEDWSCRCLCHRRAALHGSEAGPQEAREELPPRERLLLKTLLLDCIQITDDRALVCRHCEAGIEASANKPIPHEDGCVVGQIQEMIKTEAGPQEAR